MIEDIIGGVSPLKARQASRGGKRAGKATATTRRRGGFGKSKGKRGGGGRNVGGYNVNTKFTPDQDWVKPAGGTGSYFMPNTAKGILGDPEGTSGTEKRTLPGEKAKKGNEFADNCYGAAGERLEGTSYYSEKKGMQIACAWDEDAKDDGSFDYDKGATDSKDQSRGWKKTPTVDGVEGVTTYEEWKDITE